MNCFVYLGAVLRRFRKDPDLKNFDYHTVYPSIVCAVESIIKYMSPSLSLPSSTADKLHVEIKKNKDKKDSATATLSYANNAYEEDFEENEKRIDGVSIQMNEDDINLKF